MARELKFRSWDEEERVWVPVEHIAITAEGQLLTFEPDVDCWCIEVLDLLVSRFTGLLDKNGKEIYEGDVCNLKEYPYPKVKCCEVIWGCEHGWGFRGYYNGKGSGDFYGVRAVAAHEIEIIGNIYENPELLMA